MPAARVHCAWVKFSYGYVSGCGIRTPYTRKMKWCPYCRKPIINLSRETADKKPKCDKDEEE